MSTQPKVVAFHTLGCKLNFSETSTIARDFIKYGFKRVDYKDYADFYVINTCSVTENADREARKLIRQAKRKNPNASVAVIGCYAQLKPNEIAAIEGVDLVVGASEKFNLLKHLDEIELKSDKIVINSEIKHVNQFRPSYSLAERTRSYLKIQDGCDYNCTFCTIPLARGRSRSDTVDSTIKTALELSEQGVKEIVMTGVNIGDFGKDSDENFFDLLLKMDDLKKVERIRISSIEPNLLSDKIIEFCNASKLFMPHFHIPLQSGSNKILKYMRRKYNREFYRKKIETIKSVNGDTCIGVDVMVGFPGETEDDFLDTYKFLTDLDISYLHVFSFSERSNTDAIKISKPVPKEVRSERSKMLHMLSDKKQNHFYNENLSKKREVLFETMKNNSLFGHTDNYIKVKINESPALINNIRSVKLSKVKNNLMLGSL